MWDRDVEWLPMDAASTRFGYGHKESLRRRLRQLRQKGKVVDLGKPPPGYAVEGPEEKGKVVIFWPNSKTALIRSDALADLLNPRRGKRSRK